MEQLELLNKKIAKNIEKTLIDKGIKKKELAKKLNIQEQSVSSILRKLKRGETLNSATICRIAEAVGVEASIFYSN